MAAIPTSQPRPFIPAPGVVAIEAVYTCNGQKCENVYHALMGDGATQPTDAQKHAIAGALIGWENTTAKASRHNATQLELVRVRDLNVAAGTTVEQTADPPVVGTAGAGVPNNVTVAIKWTTAFGGRSFRGRTYHVGLPLSVTVGNQLTNAGQTFLLATYASFRDAMEAVTGLQLVVVSYAHNKFWRSTALATHITGRAIDINLDSQRRRLTGRGS